MKLGLQDQVALVSGGSRGIGFAVVASLLAEGARVALTARDGETLQAATGKLAAIAGADRVLPLVADMGDESAVSTVIDTVESTFGPIGIAVANAGSGRAKAGVALQRADWQAALEANLYPATLLAGALLPRMMGRRQGSLTLISSIAGREAIRAPIPYAAAKAALDMAVKGWAQQAGPAGVRVNAVAPGNVLVPGGSWAEKLLDPEKKLAFGAYIASEVPLQRFATPREVADAVLFLASARASFITGAILPVDGGQLRAV